MFGKEVAAICDRHMDYFVIVPVAMLSTETLASGRWAARFLVRGTLPTAEEKRALSEMLRQIAEGFEKIADTLKRE